MPLDNFRMDLLVVFFVALIISVIFSPVSIKVAHLIGAIDVPKDDRRMHKKAVPRFGGLAIFISINFTLILFRWHEDQIQTVLLGGLLIYAIGILDDLFNLNAKLKFLLEFAIALMLYHMGLRITYITNYFGEGTSSFGSGIALVFTVLWLVGITNTINLIDGLDGLATGVTAIGSLSVAYVAYIHGRYEVCGAMLAITGSTIGFLPFNFYPAKTFMGDGGSLFLGYMMAALSVLSPLKQSTVVTLMLPVVVLGIPIFDTFFAILRRIINRRPIMEADKGHLHHRLMESGYGQRRSVLMLYGISSIMGMAAISVSRDLIIEGVALVFISFLFVYVFLTDPNHKLPRIKAVNIEEIEKSEEKKSNY